VDDAAQLAFSEFFGTLESTRAGADGEGSKLIVLTNIGPDGTISYPFLGVLSVEGKTTSELEKLLSGMLQPDYLFDPQVAVDFKQYVQETVSVTGEVNAPGPVEIPSDRKLDLHEAITRARDLKPTANPDLIQVTREGWDKPRMFKYKEILGVTDPSKRFYVEPNDKIWVAPRIF
jgi:polysaccharide export outer membrane protein